MSLCGQRIGLLAMLLAVLSACTREEVKARDMKGGHLSVCTTIRDGDGREYVSQRIVWSRDGIGNNSVAIPNNEMDFVNMGGSVIAHDGTLVLYDTDVSFVYSWSVDSGSPRLLFRGGGFTDLILLDSKRCSFSRRCGDIDEIGQATIGNDGYSIDVKMAASPLPVCVVRGDAKSESRLLVNDNGITVAYTNHGWIVGSLDGRGVSRVPRTLPNGKDSEASSISYVRDSRVWLVYSESGQKMSFVSFRDGHLAPVVVERRFDKGMVGHVPKIDGVRLLYLDKVGADDQTLSLRYSGYTGDRPDRACDGVFSVVLTKDESVSLGLPRRDE